MLIKNAAGFTVVDRRWRLTQVLPCAAGFAKHRLADAQGEFVREQNYVYDNVLKGSAVPLTVPEWTDATDWAAVCDGGRPGDLCWRTLWFDAEIYIAGNELSPAVFMNDEHRLKIRHFLAVWVNDFRPLHKSNVA